MNVRIANARSNGPDKDLSCSSSTVHPFAYMQIGCVLQQIAFRGFHCLNDDDLMGILGETLESGEVRELRSIKGLD